MESTSVASAGSSQGATSQSSSSQSQSQGQSQSQSPSSGGQASGQGQRAATWGNPNAQETGASQEGANQSQDQSQPKKLGDADMDALVTVKIDGETKEITVREAVKLHQLQVASQNKMNQAAEMRRQAQEIMQMDIRELAKLRGQDFRELAEQELAQAYELMNMSPEQRRLHELEQREAHRNQMETASKQEVLSEIKNYVDDLPPGAENATREQLHAYLNQVKHVYQMTEQNLEREFVEAWQETGLPKTPFIGARMAFMMKTGKNDDGTPLQTKDAAVRVQKAYVNDVREFFTKMDAKAIHETLGKEILQKLRDFDVQRVTSQQASNVNQMKSPGQQPASEPKKYLNQMEWRKAMGLS